TFGAGNRKTSGAWFRWGSPTRWRIDGVGAGRFSAGEGYAFAMGVGTSGALCRRVACASRIEPVAGLAAGDWVVVVCGCWLGVRGGDGLVWNGPAAGQDAMEQADAR